MKYFLLLAINLASPLYFNLLWLLLSLVNAGLLLLDQTRATTKTKIFYIWSSHEQDVSKNFLNGVT